MVTGRGRWVALMSLVAAAVLALAWGLRGQAQEAPPPGFQSLLHGKDLSGWKLGAIVLDGMPETPGGHWRVRDGGVETDGAGGSLDTARSFDRDCMLRVECRIEAGASAGLGLRGPRFPLRNFAKSGPPAYAAASRPAGEWNEVEVAIRNRAAIVRINGKLLEAARVEADLTQSPPEVKVDGKPVTGPFELLVLPAAAVKLNGQVLEPAFRLPLRGPISLQAERGKAWFRRLYLREF